MTDIKIRTDKLSMTEFMWTIFFGDEDSLSRCIVCPDVFETRPLARQNAVALLNKLGISYESRRKSAITD